MQKKEHPTATTRLDWQEQLADSFTSISALCQYLQLRADELPVSPEAEQRFPLRVPQFFADLMEKGNPNDPLLRQILPVAQEAHDYPGFSNDPVGDLDAACAPGVLHKYFGRALFIAGGGCAINCRYCFRRNFPYSDHQLSRQTESSAIDYLQAHPEISEIILSGGDPLLLNDRRLTSLIENIGAVAHIRRIRIHSRIPVVLPARLTDTLLTLLLNSEKQIVMVLHCNHANEISPQLESACRKLKQHEVMLLNQSVLLRGVNDSVEALSRLSDKLFTAGIIPYYLHLLDKAAGTGHFEISEKNAVNIVQQLQQRLPGYLVPKLVKEQAGASSKIPLTSSSNEWVMPTDSPPR